MTRSEHCADLRANTQRSPSRKLAVDVSAIAIRFAGSGGIPSQPVNMRIQTRFEISESSPLAR